MKYLLEELVAGERGAESVYALSALQRSFGCRCGRSVFFRNTQCLSCYTQLGYEPNLGRIFSIEPGVFAGSWQLRGPHVPHNHSIAYKRCANLHTAAACNWLVEVNGKHERVQPYCRSCRLNRVIPDLSIEENAVLWGRIENAKRHVLSALIALRLPLASRLSEDPWRGLAFDFLRSPATGPRVVTGHRNGLITLNIEEADDVKREQMRTSMREPYRTLVGHIRHEVGHHYWDRLVKDSHWLARFRVVFGDERADYGAALQRNYSQGPAYNWPDKYVSAYASVHPWEDWAESWAHYLHMVDTLGTAMSFGIRPETLSMPFDCFGPDVLYDFQSSGSEQFLSFLNSWLKLTAVMNELCRSMGQPDFYPFALSPSAVTKLHFIHLVVNESSIR